MANEAVIGALRAVLGLDSADFDLALDRSKKKLSDFDKMVEAMAANGNKNLATLINVASGAFAGFQLAGVISDVANFTDRILKQTAAFKDLAEKANLSTDAYQAVRLAAAGVGVQQSAMDNSLQHLNRTIGSALEGNRQQIEIFKTLGVNLLDNSGKNRDFDKTLQLVALSLDRMQDSSLKSRLEMQLFGASGKEIDNLVHQLAGGVDQLQRKFAGDIVPAATIDNLKRLQDQAAGNQAKFEAFFAAIAGPIYYQGIDILATGMERIARAVSTPFGTDWKTLLVILANPTLLPQFFLPKLVDPQDNQNAKDQAAILKEIAQWQVLLADPRYSDARKKQIQEEIDKLKAQLAILQSIGAQQADNKKQADMQSDEDKARIGSRDVDPHTGEGKNPTPRTTGGGSKTDRVGDMIAKLKEQTTAAQKALADMIKGAQAGIPLKQVEDAVNLQKKIDDAIAELHRGGIKAGDPRIEQTKQMIKAENQAEEALRKRKEAEQEADRVERQFGDGTVAYTETVNKLWDALNTGRLTTDAFSEAMKQAGYALDDAKTKSEGAKGGIDGFIAGMKNAADQDSRTATAMKEGQEAWQITKDSISDVVGAFTDLNGNVNQVLTNVLSRISKFAFDVLVMKPLFDAIKSMITDAFTPSTGSGGGGLFGSIFSWIGGLFGGGSSPATQLASGVIPLATGGEAPVGRPYLVGEKGPELRIDSVPGTIYSHADSVQMMRDLAHGSTANMKPSSLVMAHEYGDGEGGMSLVQHINVLPDVNVSIKRQIRDNMPLFAEAGAQRTQSIRRQGGKIKDIFAGR